MLYPVAMALLLGGLGGFLGLVVVVVVGLEAVPGFLDRLTVRPDPLTPKSWTFEIAVDFAGTASTPRDLHIFIELESPDRFAADLRRVGPLPRLDPVIAVVPRDVGYTTVDLRAHLMESAAASPELAELLGALPEAAEYGATGCKLPADLCHVLTGLRLRVASAAGDDTRWVSVER